MRKTKLLFRLFCVSWFLQGAVLSQSIHQEQSELYRAFNLTAESQWDSLRAQHASSPVQPAPYSPSPRSACTLQKRVFGWHPYWMGSTYNNYNWSLISDLSYFSYEVDAATGNAVTTHNWSTAAVVTAAQANGVRVNLCATLFSSHATFLTNSTAKQNFISTIIALVQQRNANGCNIDFEGVPSSQSANFTAFMISLCNQMHAAIPGSEISIALPAVDWSNVYDVGAMVGYVDLFIIMGYDYYWSGSTTAGPTDPLYNFETSYNYTQPKSITYYLNDGVPPSQLLLGVPYYGREWPTSLQTIPSPTTASGTARIYSYVRNNPGTYSAALWDPNSFTPYYSFYTTQWNQCFINSYYSLGKRYDAVNQLGIGGIGIWALGYDDGFSELWNTIEQKFTDCRIIPCTDTIYDTGGPNRNYYDKEDYTFTLSPTNTASFTVQFSSFSTEVNYDTLWIWDGPGTNSPLIGFYHGTFSPGTFSSSGPSLTFRFKSDPGIVQSGYLFTYQCSMVGTESAEVSMAPAPWPNPLAAGEELFLGTPDGTPCRLINPAGQTLFWGITFQGKFRIPGNMAEGIYYIDYQYNDNISMHKLMILSR
ncbi:MAG: hypothetical protein IT233_04300 [Bacteroidia bacterium]|nr:hypothetical protein [Bacteroidia bacterium]